MSYNKPHWFYMKKILIMLVAEGLTDEDIHEVLSHVSGLTYKTSLNTLRHEVGNAMNEALKGTPYDKPTARRPQ